MSREVLIERVAPGAGALLRPAALVLGGIAAMALLSQIRVPLWPSPVPVTMQTFGVLMIGAAYGARLGLATMGGYVALGVLGLPVFAGAGGGVAHLLGGTGGYLVGFVLAAALLGVAARRGWDRAPLALAAAMLAAQVAIYVPGLLWLRGFASGWEQTLAWGLWPFLWGEAIKVALAALLIPAAWRLAGPARG